MGHDALWNRRASEIVLDRADEYDWLADLRPQFPESIIQTGGIQFIEAVGSKEFLKAKFLYRWPNITLLFPRVENLAHELGRGAKLFNFLPKAIQLKLPLPILDDADGRRRGLSTPASLDVSERFLSGAGRASDTLESLITSDERMPIVRYNAAVGFAAIVERRTFTHD